MASSRIHEKRITRLNDKDVSDGDYTLYWMQQSQRASCNHALEFAIQRANSNKSRLLVVFGLADDYPDANLRHYRFMLEGLQQVNSALSNRSIKFVVRLGHPAGVAAELAEDACEVICDRGYLRHQRAWREQFARQAGCRVWQIESDVIVPVETASEKREFAARTIRSKLNEASGEHLTGLKTTAIEKHSLNLSVDGIDIGNLDQLLNRLSIARDVPASTEFSGGLSQAKAHLKNFLSSRINDYDDRTRVVKARVSYLSPYLHFGQISAIEVARAVYEKRGVSKDAKKAFIEELLVRRELAINFVHFCKTYDRLESMPDWALKTMSEHETDKRQFHYTATELDNAQTHDAAWNAAMIEMKYRGYLHNHLRMYWGKKIIEWTNTYQHAYRTALNLNNRYFLDGRDPNSYANIGWLFGLHDRAHQERKVLGKLRYMSADGLKRKIDVDRYIRSVEDRYGDRVAGRD